MQIPQVRPWLHVLIKTSIGGWEGQRRRAVDLIPGFINKQHYFIVPYQHWLAAKPDNTYIKTAHYNKNCLYIWSFPFTLIISLQIFSCCVSVQFFLSWVMMLTYPVLFLGVCLCVKEDGVLWLKNMKIVKTLIFSPEISSILGNKKRWENQHNQMGKSTNQHDKNQESRFRRFTREEHVAYSH